MRSARHWLAGAAGFLTAALVPAAHGADTLAYRVAIESGRNDLNAELSGVSRLVQAANNPPPGLAGLEQRADGDRTVFVAVLRSEGYYDGTVAIAIDDNKTPILVTVKVSPGQRYTLGACTIRYKSPPPEGVPKACQDLGLNPGMAARAAPIIAATELLIRRLEERGRPAAKLAERRAIADHATHRMTLAFDVDPGRAAHFGAVDVSGTKRTNPAFLARIVPWRKNATYDVRKLDEYRKRLSDLSLFDQLIVKPNVGKLDAAGDLPITVEAHEGPPHSFGGGVNYATDTGPGLKAFWEHRNLWGEAEHLRFDLQLATIAQSLEAALTLPHVPERGQSLGFDLKVERDLTDAYDKSGATGLAQITTPLGGHWAGIGGLSLEAADIRQSGSSDFSVLAGVPLGVTFDSTGSLLNPEKGERLAVQAEPAFGTSGGLRAFLILSGAATAYRPLDADSKFVAAARIRLGSILFAPQGGVPADLRFYSGGGGSVRGYGYQRIGPRDAAGNPVGGRGLGETSFELRYRAWKDIGIVGFVDTGMVSESPYFADAGAPRVGAGLGLRYYTGFGPLRLDIGTPLNPQSGDGPVQVYVSLGQAF
ncbi:MAG: autotransporter assembly complex protein TamA [Alphaproteobacteria bacterium]|nr:autotransporter assembly complex protein TamA [Alphaproteobacteria bacterium]